MGPRGPAQSPGWPRLSRDTPPPPPLPLETPGAPLSPGLGTSRFLSPLPQPSQLLGAPPLCWPSPFAPLAASPRGPARGTLPAGFAFPLGRWCCCICPVGPSGGPPCGGLLGWELAQTSHIGSAPKGSRNGSHHPAPFSTGSAASTKGPAGATDRVAAEAAPRPQRALALTPHSMATRCRSAFI